MNAGHQLLLTRSNGIKANVSGGDQAPSAKPTPQPEH
jgi:hypothetical protein